MGTERFSIVRRLGAGGMGIVYLAYDREGERQVALKTLHTRNPGEIFRLKNEFRALAGLSHPNLAQLYELVADGDRCFFTMEYVEGTDFLSYAQGDASTSPSKRTTSPTAATAVLPSEVGYNETLPAGEVPSSTRVNSASAVTPFAIDEARLQAVLAQLVRAIHALHTGRMLHLDIKPSNVLVTAEGRVVVLDFGLVTHLEASRTRSGASPQQSGGTPAYMAPEQALSQGVCEASDWYGVGTMLFEVLTRTLPFEGSVMDVLRQKLSTEAPHPLKRNPLAPQLLGELCFEMLRRSADARPAVSTLAAALEVELTHESILGVPERAVSLIGRASHAQALREAFDEVRRGNVVSAFVHGPSGMGKTALVQAFLEELVVGGAALVLSGRCYERESVPYKAFDSLIDELYLYLADLHEPDLEALLPPHVGALARLFPVLVQLPRVAAEARKVEGIMEAQELRRQGFAALRELLQRLASKRRTVLFIDDLQWGDLDSAALLGDLLRPPD
ncbi:MAG: serine/threonine-protein kinase, partial [Minicystis sp.]